MDTLMAGWIRELDTFKTGWIRARIHLRQGGSELGYTYDRVDLS